MIIGVIEFGLIIKIGTEQCLTKVRARREVGTQQKEDGIYAELAEKRGSTATEGVPSLPFVLVTNPER